MSFPIWCLLIGASASMLSFVLKDLFVDSSDVKNPFRTLVRSLGYIGVAVVAYGALLLLIQPS
ncbi:MAG: hypothetical protein RIC56_08095 [Pseudomonadales bacterium]